METGIRRTTIDRAIFKSKRKRLRRKGYKESIEKKFFSDKK